jgi:hypothetical protein
MDSRPASVTSNNYNSETNDSVKVATPDILILTDEAMSPEIMTDLIFEDIGGQEIISIARNDIINGQNVLYQPIKNITSLFYQYNPQNILALPKTDKDYFKNFPISLQSHIPECGTGYDVVNNVEVSNCRYVYVDPATSNLIINVINMLPGQEVEVQIMTTASVLDDTIY